MLCRYLFGIACRDSAALGTALWRKFSRRIDRSGAGDGPIRGLAIGAGIMALGTGSIAFAPSCGILLATVSFVLIGGATLVVLPALSVHALSRGEMQARLTALDHLRLDSGNFDEVHDPHARGGFAASGWRGYLGEA